jgi:hypothetical protein
LWSGAQSGDGMPSFRFQELLYTLLLRLNPLSDEGYLRVQLADIVFCNNQHGHVIKTTVRDQVEGIPVRPSLLNTVFDCSEIFLRRLLLSFLIHFSVCKVLRP